MEKPVRLTCLILVLALCLPVPSLAAEEWVLVSIGDTSVRWDVQGDFEAVILKVAQPNGKVLLREHERGEAVVFDVDRSAKDGVYTYEVRGIPHFDESVRKELSEARKLGPEAECKVIEALEEAGLLPAESVKDGSFTVQNGVLVRPDLKEEGQKIVQQTAAAPRKTSGDGVQVITAADQVIPDDLIVQGSLCVGFDCVNNESFSFDTIRLKENNLRIKFDDTSTVAGFPNRDWQITVNDSASGGQSKFSIEDITGARVPFTVEAAATTNSIYVDSTGRVGFRTATPVLDIHIATSNTPGIRLEQNSSGGFTAQTWDIAGNEANFFIRDVTGGSRLPFRIRPGAPTSSIDISATGNVGIGTASPDRPLEVSRSGAVEIGLENTSGTAAKWFFQVDNDANKTLKWSKEGTGGTEVIVDQRLDANGATFRVDGSVQATNVVFASSRDLKQGFEPLDPQEVLTKVASLPITRWRFKEGPGGVEHIGPMAEDFHATFGLNPDPKTISMTDTSGVALAAIQGLQQMVAEKDAEVAALRQHSSDLEKRLASLEALVSSLADDTP